MHFSEIEEIEQIYHEHHDSLDSDPINIVNNNASLEDCFKEKNFK